MKAIQVQKTGGPEVLTLVDLPVPKPKANEAVVKIAASGVNFIDVYFREGRYPAALPFIDGQEAAGTVTEVGSDVKSVKAGRSRGLQQCDRALTLSMLPCLPTAWSTCRTKLPTNRPRQRCCKA